MNIIKFCLYIILFLGISCARTDSSELEEFFVENVDDWHIEGDAYWKFVNNELVARINSGAGFIMTKDVFSDFEMSVDFYPDSTINSGIFIRCKNKALSTSDCYEINIWDLRPNQEYRTGAIVERSNPLNQVETLNKWNTYKIKILNNHLQTWINNVITTDFYNNDLDAGHIALQASGSGKIRFRNIKITPLKNSP